MSKRAAMFSAVLTALYFACITAEAQVYTQGCSQISGNVSTGSTNGPCWNGNPTAPEVTSCSLIYDYSTQCMNTNLSQVYATGSLNNVSPTGWAYCDQMLLNCSGPTTTCTPAAVPSAGLDSMTGQLRFIVQAYSYSVPTGRFANYSMCPQPGETDYFWECALANCCVAGYPPLDPGLRLASLRKRGSAELLPSRRAG